jgi:hypothetical protein
VCQHVENLSSAALEEYADIIRDLVHRQHGVYALYRRDKLYYVGLASNLRSRLRAHLRDRHKGLWDRFSVYLTIEDGHLRELESLVIRIAQPRGNKQRGKLARSENMTKLLVERLRERHRDELSELVGRKRKRPSRSEARRPAARKPAKGGLPPLGRYLSRGRSLRGVYKGKSHKGRARKDGTISVGGKTYNSPSLAAAAVVGHPINGWWFWKYERAPGHWVRLRELRRK